MMVLFVRERWIYIYGWVLIASFALQSCEGTCTDNSTVIEQLVASPTDKPTVLVFHPNMNCTRNITAPGNDQVKIDLTNWHLRRSDNCTINRVIVFDGPDESSKKLVQYCYDSGIAIVKEAAIFSTAQSISVMMQTDSNTNTTFFTSIVYATVPKLPEPCAADSTASVQLYTTNQTVVQRVLLRHSNMNCTLNITSPANSQVKLHLTASPVRKVADCTNDKVVVYDGPDESGKKTLQYCYSKDAGSDTETIFSSSQSVSVLLQTDVNRTATISAVIAYEAVPLLPACSSSNTVINVNSSTSATLRGPGDFINNPANKLCVWKIVAPVGQIIKLTFTSNSANKVKVFDSGKADNNYLVGTFAWYHTNYKNGDPIYSTGRYMYVQFEAPSPTNLRGSFEASMVAFEPATICSPSGSAEQNQNIHLPTASGNITSPGYPNVIATSGYKCGWYITVPEGKVVKLNIHSLYLDGGYTYGGNFVYGYSGRPYGYNTLPRSNTRLLLRSYRSRRPPMIVTYNRYATVILDVARKNAYTKGLWIEYSPVTLVSSNACKGDTDATIQIRNESEGVIISPNFPLPAPKNMTCRWNITVPEGQVVKLTFQSLSDDCESHRVKLFDGMNTDSPLISCSSNRYHIYSQSRHLLVEFKKNSSIGSGQILAIFVGVKSAPKSCSANKPVWTLTASNGTLASYNYPEPYPSDVLCIWTIKALQYQVIKLTFKSFALQASDKCDKDYLQVSSTKSNYYEKLGTFCGSTTPAPVIGVRNEMYLKFRSDWASGASGFVATYEAINDTSWRDCSSEGVELTTATGSIYSPRYPRPFPSQVTCFWKIAAPPERHIRLTVHHFELTSSDSKLTISEGPSLNDSLIGSYSGYIYRGPPVFYSKGQHFYIRFTSSYKSENWYRKGFHLAYETTLQTLPYSIACSAKEKSRKLTDKTGVIASEGFPNNYSNGVDCGFSMGEIAVDSITLTFESFDLEPSPDCSLDYVEVFDGAYSGVSPSLGKFCGNKIPSPVTSTNYGHMFVRFVSSGSGRYPGFKASYKYKYPLATIYVVLIIVACVLGALALLYGCVYLYKKKMATVNHAPPATMSSLELVDTTKM